MWLKHQPVYSPDMETGSAEDVGGAPPPEVAETPAVSDGPGSGRSELRKQLEKSAESERKGREAREAKSTKDAPSKSKQTSRAKEILDAGTEPEEEALLASAEAEGEQPEQVEVKEKAPDSFSKEAKAQWAGTPEVIRNAILKRETDMARGVEELKARYSDIDQVLAPRINTIKQHGHSPAQAVNQLFAWFEALAANPQQAFPALAQSFRFDLKSLLNGQAQTTPPTEQDPKAQQQQGPIPDELQNYLRSLERKFEERLSGVTQQFSRQSEERTKEILDSWSKDKPYFEDVRMRMSQLIASGAIPPLPNGAADLDAAYDQALFSLPDVRARVLKEQRDKEINAIKEKREKERLAQQQQADKARRASGSLASGAPGDPATQGKKPKSKSVRESILEAAELARGGI